MAEAEQTSLAIEEELERICILFVAGEVKHKIILMARSLRTKAFKEGCDAIRQDVKNGVAVC